MRHQIWFWGMAVATSGLFMAGCGSLRAGRGSASTKPPSATSSAEPASDRAIEKAARAHAHYAAGIIHEMQEEHEAALQEFYQAAQADPDDESLVLNVSRRLLQNKQPEKALELLKNAAARPNASGAILARLAMVYSQLGKYDLALSTSRAAIKRSPEVLAGYQNLFLTLLQNKHEAEALKVLEEAAARPDANAEFLLGVSDLYTTYVLQVPSQSNKVHPKALAILNRVDKLNPPEPMLRARLADGLNMVGEWERAARLYLDLLKKLPDLPFIRERIHSKLADIYIRGSDRKRAMEQLEAVVREDPTNPQAYFFLGSLAYDEKKLPEACDYFRKVLLLDPDFEQAYYDLALAQISLKKTSDALATLEKARQKFSESFLLEFWEAVAYSHDKAYSQALAHFNRAEVIAKAAAPQRLTAAFYFQFGAACERSGDLPQAERYFQKCLQLEPDSAEAMNYLGYMWAEHGMKLDEARNLIEKAVKAEPKNAAYLDSLGWVFFKLNQPREALEYIRKAVELSEEPDPTLFDHLGDVYAALGEPTKAREAWTKSLALEPNEQVRKKLEPAEGK